MWSKFRKNRLVKFPLPIVEVNLSYREICKVRATITLYPIGRPVRATITLYPIGDLLELLLHCIL